jgi:hypothetical protein
VKKQISVAVLLVGAGVMMMCAATPADPCAEKHKGCTDACGITQSQSLRRGVDRLQAENAFNRCVKACDKTKADCDPKVKKP